MESNDVEADRRIGTRWLLQHAMAPPCWLRAEAGGAWRLYESACQTWSTADRSLPVYNRAYHAWQKSEARDESVDSKGRPGR